MRRLPPIVTLLIAIGVIALILAMQSCRTPAPAVPPPPVRTITVRVGCLPPVPRPTAGEVHLTAPGEAGCPAAGFEFCATWEAAGAIEKYIRRAEAWMEQAELACKEESIAKPNPNPEEPK